MAVFVLDAPSLVYRAFFALPKTLVDGQGRPVNAVRGFMEMTTRLLIDRRPARLIAAFDRDWRPEFRVRAYPGYKSARPSDPPELPRQFEVLEDVLDAAGIARAGAEGLEADDVIATLAASIPEGEQVVVVSGDRDLLSLVRDPRISVLFPVRGTKEMKEFDEGAVEMAFGIPPRLYADFAILRGDASDGLPGVRGIGPKTAAALLKEHGSVANLLAGGGGLPERQRKALDDARDYLEAMKTVVTLVSDADVTLTDSRAPDEERLRALAEEHNLGSSAARLAQALRGER